MGGLVENEKQHYKRKWEIPDDYDSYWYFRKYYDTKIPMLKRLQYLDFHTYLHDDILTKVDRVSMAVSLECRVPFLSRNLIEYAFSLNEQILYNEGNLKGLLKLSFKDYLPNEILTRSKKGFSIPQKSWRRLLINKHQSEQEAILKELYGA